MPRLIGLDEAGYGPNLGPLVIGASCWDVPDCDAPWDRLWEALSEVVSPDAADAERLHVADSKQVHQPNNLAALELPTQCLLRAAGVPCDSFFKLWEAVAGSCFPEIEPWFCEGDLELPVAADEEPIRDFGSRFGSCLAAAEISLVSLRADVVLTRRFNETTERAGNKAQALSRITLGLLRSLWSTEHRLEIVADKHGGRDRYDALLADELGEATGDAMILRQTEGRAESRYVLQTNPHRTTISFRKQAESHLPVAVASMLAKYLREVAMVMFNRFWTRHVPELRETKGYPTDASRFRRDVETARKRLGIGDRDFWRQR